MNPVQEYFPPVVFASLAYHMFHYLFGWHDTNWDKSNKPKYFQCTPRPTSTKIIYHWCCIGRDQVIGEYEKVSMNDDYNNNGFSSSNSVSGKTVEIEEMANSLLKNRKNTISNSEDNYDDSDTTPVNDSEVGLDYTPTSSSRPTTFDVKCLQCPMALIYGDKDEIIDADRLAHECSLSKDVQLVLAEKIAGYEHLDPLWAVDAKARVFDKIVYAMKSSNQRCNNIHQ